jgi:CRP-like cAMP-binding protein
MGRQGEDAVPPSTDGARPERNRLLAALPRAEYEALIPRLEDVRLAHGQVLGVRGAPIEHVYFPRDAVASTIVVTGADRFVGGGSIGSEGMTGLAVSLDDGTSGDDVICHIPGDAARMEAGAFRAAFERSPQVREILRRYTLALLGQVTRTAGCNLVHTLEQRCARWLLMTDDRVDGKEFLLTHDLLAAILGVRRPPLSVAARRLQQAGLIRYRRGCMQVLDRDRLQAAACDDYRLTREIYDRLFSGLDGAGSLESGGEAVLRLRRSTKPPGRCDHDNSD